MTDRVLSHLIDAAMRAGARIMADWGHNQPTHKDLVIQKVDGSPVTQTDGAAEAIVLAAIQEVSPAKIVAEEMVHAGFTPEVHAGESFWLVDALDGTREFICGKRDFTVNIALIENGHPVFGIIHAPAHNITWHAKKGEGAYRNGARIHVRDLPQEGLTILAGKRATEPGVLDPYIGTHVFAQRQQRSSSLKFCLVAEGHADLYARPGHTYEWDTAAGDIILREAGGMVMDITTRKAMVYGKTHAQFENEGFLAGSLNIFKIQAP